MGTVRQSTASDGTAETTILAPLFDADELERLLQPEGTPVSVDGVSIDSRTLTPGDLFVALAGEDPRYHGAGGGGRDGHDFVAAAGAAGAAAALVRGVTGAALPELVVADPYAALWSLADAARARLAEDTPVFALTGSSGKTTARGMLVAALEALFGPDRSVHASVGSLNNHIGVPLSLARTPRDAAAAVFEIGTNSHGEIAPLSRRTRPTVSLLLNVLPVHLEGLGDLAGVRREKLGIAAGLPKEGVLVLHASVAPPEAPAHGVLTFGREPGADVRLLDDDPDRAEVRLPDGACLSVAGIADGPHRRLTATAVLALLHATGLDASAAVAAIASEDLPAGRGRVRDHGGVVVVDDAYNANPESVRLALGGLVERARGPTVALLGDMLELGADSASHHRALAGACAGVDHVFLVGEEMAALRDALGPEGCAGWWPDCESIELDAVLAVAAPGATVLVKGSNRLFWAHGTVTALSAALDAR